MHSFLRGKMIEAKITITALAAQIGVTEKTLRNKINGETDFTWPEALAIRNIVCPGMDIEVLFAVDKQEVTA